MSSHTIDLPLILKIKNLIKVLIINYPTHKMILASDSSRNIFEVGCLHDNTLKNTIERIETKHYSCKTLPYILTTIVKPIENKVSVTTPLLAL